MIIFDNPPKMRVSQAICELSLKKWGLYKLCVIIKENMKQIKAILLIVILSMINFSCKKNIHGCTDPSSDNYNVEANVDNGSCIYHGNLTNWYDTTTRDSLLANNIASVSIYVDNDVIQIINPNAVIWSFEPDCSTTTIGNWITMQGTKSKTVSITVKGLDGANVEIRNWSQTMTINAGECKLYQLIW
jgi:hypothetical protein